MTKKRKETYHDIVLITLMLLCLYPVTMFLTTANSENNNKENVNDLCLNNSRLIAFSKKEVNRVDFNTTNLTYRLFIKECAEK